METCEHGKTLGQNCIICRNEKAERSPVERCVMPLPDLTEKEEKKFREIGKKKISELTGQEWDEYNSFNIRILKALQKQCEGKA
jgi:hypothetical protein